MSNKIVFSPHFDFYISKSDRDNSQNMKHLHFHKKYEVYFVLYGEVLFFTAENTYTVHKGDLILIPVNTIHKTSTTSPNNTYSRIVLNFSGNFFRILTEAESAKILRFFGEDLKVISIPSYEFSYLEKQFNLMVDEFNENNKVATPMLQLLLAQVLIYSNKFHTQNANHNLSRINDTVVKIQQYIVSNYANELTLASISAEFFLSQSYLSRLFKKNTGLNIMEYINSIRMLKARDLLENTDLLISDICMRVGFNTTIHFTRIFKQTLGTTPSKYRKHYKNQ